MPKFESISRLRLKRERTLQDKLAVIQAALVNRAQTVAGLEACIHLAEVMEFTLNMDYALAQRRVNND